MKYAIAQTSGKQFLVKPGQWYDIDFINNACVPLTSLENPTQSFQPQVGDMFIFPSRLIHCVHPFIGPGERRSVSVNAFHLAQFDD